MEAQKRVVRAVGVPASLMLQELTDCDPIQSRIGLRAARRLEIEEFEALCIKRQFAVSDELFDGGRCDRLGETANSQKGIGRRRFLLVGVRPAESTRINQLAISRNDGRRCRTVNAVHERKDGLVERRILVHGSACHWPRLSQAATIQRQEDHEQGHADEQSASARQHSAMHHHIKSVLACGFAFGRIEHDPSLSSG